MISYAQNFEDVMLARVFQGKTHGFYIDVGAMDPVETSVTKHFYDLGWSGINIEPDTRFYEKLVAERPRDINLDTPLGAKETTRTFYHSSQHGISTFDKKVRDFFQNLSYPYEKQKRKVATLAKVCREHVRSEIDFLKIDVEGWELEVLRGGDWKTFRPCVVVLEATEPCSHTPAWQKWEPLLLGFGYNFVYYDGLNRFYLREENPELKGNFDYPPNVLDGFSPYILAQTFQERDQARVECADLRSKSEDLGARVDAEKTRAALLAAECQRAQIMIQEAQAEHQRIAGQLAQLGQENNAACERSRQLQAEKDLECQRVELACREVALLQREICQLRQELDWERHNAIHKTREMGLQKSQAEQLLRERDWERDRYEHLVDTMNSERQRAVELIAALRAEGDAAHQRAESLIQESEAHKQATAALVEQLRAEIAVERQRAESLVQERDTALQQIAGLVERLQTEKEASEQHAKAERDAMADLLKRANAVAQEKSRELDRLEEIVETAAIERQTAEVRIREAEAACQSLQQVISEWEMERQHAKASIEAGGDLLSSWSKA